MPAVVDTDGGLYVVKFRGAGQGPKALVAEIVTGLIANALELRTPDLAIVVVPEPFGRGEPDPEIQHILGGSHGVNVGLRYLDGAFNFALSAAGDLIDPEWAARVVWLDAFLTNPDRTARNTNMLVHDRAVWLIDHGASLYAHHDWSRVDAARTSSPFPLIRDHVLLPVAPSIALADVWAAGTLSEERIEGILKAVPDVLLEDPAGANETPEVARGRYRDYLLGRLRAPRAFVEEAERARTYAAAEPPARLGARR